jgi:hypothetical protein
LVLAVSCPALLAGRSAGTGATIQPDHITLTWTGDTATTMTVTWRTDTTVTAGLVEYEQGATLAGTAHRTGAHASTFTSDLGAARLFTATLTGLSPGATYAYRVGDGTHWSGTHAFTTADPSAPRFSFLVFGDSQSSVSGASPYGSWHDTVHNAYRANPGARFMVNVGDLVDVGQSCAHWNAWFAAAAGVIDRIPEMPVVGNHEIMGRGDTARPSYWNAQFRLPQNGPPGLKNQAYSYDIGPVHLVVLDSQQGEEDRYGDIFPPQQRWLEADLAASTATWTIAFFHKTPYSLKANRPNPGVKAAFCPILERHHVDLVFAGHDHGVARTYPIRDGAIMEKPSQGTTYYITGRSGDKTYDDLARTSWDTFFYNPQDQPNYLVVEVEGRRLTVTVMKRDGTLVDTLVIDKEDEVGPAVGASSPG